MFLAIRGEEIPKSAKNELNSQQLYFQFTQTLEFFFVLILCEACVLLLRCSVGHNKVPHHSLVFYRQVKQYIVVKTVKVK